MKLLSVVLKEGTASYCAKFKRQMNLPINFIKPKIINILNRVLFGGLVALPYLIYLNLKLIWNLIHHKKVVIFDFYEFDTFYEFYKPFLANLEANQHVKIYIATQFVFNRPLYKKSFHEHGLNDQVELFFPFQLGKYLIFSDLFISAHLYGVTTKRSDRVYIAHNMPVKWWIPTKETMVNFNIWFISNLEHMNQMNEAILKYGLDFKEHKLIPVGYPKLDTILNSKLDKLTIYKELNLDKRKKTLLYAPSWEEGLSLREIGIQLINTVIKMREYNLIIKLHPSSLVSEKHRDYNLLTGGINWSKEIAEFINLKNVYVSNSNSNEANFIISDLMITDVSSVALEFKALNKKVIYYSSENFFKEISPSLYKKFGNANLTYSQRKNSTRINAGRTEATVFRNLDELKSLIKIILTTEFEWDDFMYSQLVPYNLGRATHVANRVIDDLLFNSNSTNYHRQD